MTLAVRDPTIPDLIAERYRSLVARGQSAGRQIDALRQGRFSTVVSPELVRILSGYGLDLEQWQRKKLLQRFP